MIIFLHFYSKIAFQNEKLIPYLCFLRYILEKLRQEQELYEIQQRKKIIQEQQEKEKRCQQQQQQQQQHQVQIYRNECKIEPTKVAPVVDVQCVDNIQLYTKRIIEENRKSTEIYEERRVTSSTTNNNGCHHWSTSTSSSNAVPVVPKGVSVIGKRIFFSLFIQLLS